MAKIRLLNRRGGQLAYAALDVFGLCICAVGNMPECISDPPCPSDNPCTYNTPCPDLSKFR